MFGYVQKMQIVHLIPLKTKRPMLYTRPAMCIGFLAHAHGRPCAYVSEAIHTADNAPGTHQMAPQTLKKYKILI